MKRFVSVVLSAALISACFAARAAHAQSKDEQAIRALEDRFAAAFRAKDLDAMMKVYAPGDGIFVFDLSAPREYVGYDAYRKDWASLFDGAQGPIQFDVSELVIETDGKLGYSHSIQHVAYTANDGSRKEMTVRVTDVFRKMGGKWLVVHEHVSVPIDSSGKPDMMSRP